MRAPNNPTMKFFAFQYRTLSKRFHAQFDWASLVGISQKLPLYCTLIVLTNLILQPKHKIPSSIWYVSQVLQKRPWSVRILQTTFVESTSWVHEKLHPSSKKFCKMAIIEFCNLLHEIGSSRTNQFAVKVSSTTNHVWRFASVGLKGQFTFSTAFIIVVATTIPTVASSSTFNFSHSSK